MQYSFAISADFKILLIEFISVQLLLHELHTKKILYL